MGKSLLSTLRLYSKLKTVTVSVSDPSVKTPKAKEAWTR